jgi:hypothetical protein
MWIYEFPVLKIDFPFRYFTQVYQYRTWRRIRPWKVGRLSYH